jgi:hypothetical protein
VPPDNPTSFGNHTLGEYDDDVNFAGIMCSLVSREIANRLA